jgi:hypothetical protein
LPQVGRSLRGVKQVHGIEVANAGSSRQFSRRELQSDRLAGILIERKDGHVQARQRLLDEGAGGLGEGHAPASQHHGLTVAPDTEQHCGLRTDGAPKQICVVEAFSERAGGLRPGEGLLRRPGAAPQ